MKIDYVIQDEEDKNWLSAKINQYNSYPDSLRLKKEIITIISHIEKDIKKEYTKWKLWKIRTNNHVLIKNINIKKYIKQLFLIFLPGNLDKFTWLDWIELEIEDIQKYNQ